MMSPFDAYWYKPWVWFTGPRDAVIEAMRRQNWQLVGGKLTLTDAQWRALVQTVHQIWYDEWGNTNRIAPRTILETIKDYGVMATIPDVTLNGKGVEDEATWGSRMVRVGALTVVGLVAAYGGMLWVFRKQKIL